jgi:hypothetical protein
MKSDNQQDLDNKRIENVIHKDVSILCFLGWDDIIRNKSGRCCCNCEYQQPITAHPWNKNPSFQGKCSTVIGWGCVNPELAPFITFSEREHSMCECHRHKIQSRSTEHDQ